MCSSQTRRVEGPGRRVVISPTPISLSPPRASVDYLITAMLPPASGRRGLIPLEAGSLHPGQLQLVGTVTGDETGGGNLLPCRCLGPAYLDRVRTARVEIAPTGWRSGIRHFP